MKATLILVGTTQDPHVGQLTDLYLQRIQHYMPLTTIVIPQPKNTKSLSQEQQKQLEGTLILQKLKPDDTLVLLDENGEEYTSQQFAHWLQNKQNTIRSLVFAIGGPYGFSQQVRQQARHSISLSRMTFSHQFVRAIFAEQLYRACTIISGHPYHHQ